MDMLQIKNVTKSFGGIKALQECSFEISANQITAVIGPNGAGKTTLFDVISGLLEADAGKILFDYSPNPLSVSPYPTSGGQGEKKIVNLLGLSPDKIANLGVSRTFQQVRLFRNLTILDHLVMAEGNKDTKLLRNLFPLTPTLSRGGRGKGENEYLKKFGIDKPLDTLVSELSYGQRKLLQLAIAVRRQHQLLLLDEPVAGVNKVMQQEIENLLLEFKKRGETVVIIDHDMEFVRRLADKVVMMDAGKVLVEGSPDRVLRDRRVLEAYLGE